MDNIIAQTLFLGKKVIDLPNCRSTNTYTTELLTQKGAPEGTIVTTQHQTGGRGQRGNSWEAEAGKNLTFSLILKPSFLLVQEQFYLTIITSLAIHDFLTELLPRGLAIKWPNDIYHFNKKIGGILIENSLKNSSLEWSVLGIGLNVNQASFQNEKAGSLFLATGKEFSLPLLLEQLLLKLEKRYLQLRNGLRQELRKEYLERLFWIGEWHTFLSGAQPFQGKIIGIDKDGRLAICRSGEDEVRYFSIKEIEFVA